MIDGAGADQPVMRAVTSRGKIVDITNQQLRQSGRRSVAERILLDTGAARSAHATLMFRALLVVALIVAAIAVWN